MALNGSLVDGRALGRFDGDRWSPTNGRMSGVIKSALCETLKWHISKGSFSIKVPNTLAAEPVRDWLWKAGEPMGQYFKHGKVVGWQWNLETSAWRALWSFNSPRLLDDPDTEDQGPKNRAHIEEVS